MWVKKKPQTQKLWTTDSYFSWVHWTIEKNIQMGVGRAVVLSIQEKNVSPLTQGVQRVWVAQPVK